MELLSSNIFKKGSWVPDYLTEYSDPRWDFTVGAFGKIDANSQTLERVEAKSVIAGEYVSASITNTISCRFSNPVKLKDLLADNSVDGEIENKFSEFHDHNKTTINSILDKELLKRMGVN